MRGIISLLMYSINILLIGTLFLFIYIIIDSFKNKRNNLIRRLIFYSFIFYLINVAHFTIGGIVVPPQKEVSAINIQIIPFYFIKDIFHIYKMNGINWFFWNAIKLSFYNFILLIPLGIYLSLIFKETSLKNVIFISFIVSLTIELIQLLLTYMGLLIGRSFDVDDLLLNTVGGAIGFVIIELIKKFFIEKMRKYHIEHVK